jgi:hypothetical protein
MGMELWYGQIRVDMKVSLDLIKCMEKVNSGTQMATYSKVNGKRTEP